MKRYEKMTKKEIIDYFVEESEKHFDISTYDFACKIGNKLHEEIEMIPRACTFKTAEEAYKAKEAYCETMMCSDCEYSVVNNVNVPCTFNWLYKLVEKEKE